MRWLIAGLAVIGAVSCALSPERYEAIVRNCNDSDVDCTPEGIRARVLGSFPSLDVQEVVACWTAPTLFCASVDYDEDACLVQLARPPSADALELIELAGMRPFMVRQWLGATNGDYRLLEQREKRSEYGYGPVEQSVYLSNDGTRAILYIAETRCINLGEIS